MRQNALRSSKCNHQICMELDGRSKDRCHTQYLNSRAHLHRRTGRKPILFVAHCACISTNSPIPSAGPSSVANTIITKGFATMTSTPARYIRQ